MFEIRLLHFYINKMESHYHTTTTVYMKYKQLKFLKYIRISSADRRHCLL